MKWRKGPRPWTIRVFASAWIILVLGKLIFALPAYSEWEHNEATVIWAFSIFTAGIIPVFAIFGFASRFARAFVTIISIGFLATLAMQIWAWIVQNHLDIGIFAHNTAMLILVAILYHPASRPWFQKKQVWSDPKLDF